MLGYRKTKTKIPNNIPSSIRALFLFIYRYIWTKNRKLYNIIILSHTLSATHSVVARHWLIIKWLYIYSYYVHDALRWIIVIDYRLHYRRYSDGERNAYTKWSTMVLTTNYIIGCYYVICHDGKRFPGRTDLPSRYYKYNSRLILRYLPNCLSALDDLCKHPLPT